MAWPAPFHGIGRIPRTSPIPQFFPYLCRSSVRIAGTPMKAKLLLSMFLLGMTFIVQGQTTDPAYAAKLNSLYEGTVSLVWPEQLAQYMDTPQAPVILDTRSPEEFQVSHIPGARFVDYNEFSADAVAGWDQERPVVVYCTVGYRSERIGEELKELGFKYVFNLYGGIFEWMNQGHAVVDAAGSPTARVHAYSEKWSIWLQRGEKVYE
jgi:rhodanese-related sulfurtransferase